MGRKITIRNPDPGDPYGVIFGPDGQVFDAVRRVMTDYDAANFTDYVALFSAKTGSSLFYDFQFPIVAQGSYKMQTYSGASTDESSGASLGIQDIRWAGTRLEDPIKDLFHANVNFSTNGFNDEYTVSWFKNGVLIEEGINDPTLRVIKRSNGKDLFPGGIKKLKTIGDSPHFKLTITNQFQRLTKGQAAIIETEAVYESPNETQYIGEDVDLTEEFEQVVFNQFLKHTTLISRDNNPTQSFTFIATGGVIISGISPAV